VYFRYNAVQPAGSTLADALRVAMRGKDVDRIVIDVRNNHGGDNTTYAAFVDYLASPEIDQPGRVDVPVPFTAAAYFAGRDPVLDAALTRSE
jgi:hypothetical protein